MKKRITRLEPLRVVMLDQLAAVRGGEKKKSPPPPPPPPPSGGVDGESTDIDHKDWSF